MIRLYLKNYSFAECNDLYNVLHDALLNFDMNAEPYKDIVSALDYLTGYMDASKDNKKGGGKQCPHG